MSPPAEACRTTLRDRVRTIALVGRFTEPRVVDCMSLLAPHLARRGFRALVDTGDERPFPPDVVSVCPEREFAAKADLLIAIGGDGTLLRAAHLIAGRTTPLLGINHGRLGFLTDISAASMLTDVDRILDGQYIEDRRALLEARRCRPGQDEVRSLALNDVVVQRAGQARILEFETAINSQFVNAHRGDGLVVATATGSTAYALSCGGPIVVPDLEALLVTPVCPHTLSDRPLVIRSDSTLEVHLAPNSGPVDICCDGVAIGDLIHNDRFFIRKADVYVTLLHPPEHDYYRLLRSKLHWGRSR